MLIACLIAMVVILGVMTTAWIVVVRSHNAGWIDVFWTYGTGLVGVLTALSPWAGEISARQWLAAALVAVWSIRLGTYVAVRVAGSEEDQRYRDLKAQWGDGFARNVFGLIIVQAPATAILCLSIAAGALRPGPLGWTDAAAALILVVAIVGETVADRQMKAFKADTANKGQVMDKGLWGLSRHPNYLFEWFGWLAWPVMAIDLTGGWSAGWWSLAAPIVMFVILNFLTGVPPLERAMLKSKGKAYADYQSRVGAFFPKLIRS